MPKGGSRLFRRPDVLKSVFSADRDAKTLTPIDDLPTTTSDTAEPDLADLNVALATLVQIFPDVQAEVFREMLMNISKQSRVEIVTEHLLKDKGKWVNGRYRARRAGRVEGEISKSVNETDLAVEDTFRSQRYRQAVKQAFYQEFKGLSHSTVKAVLAEQNHSYVRARPVLQELASQSWRHYLTNFWSRRRDISVTEVDYHPLIEWKSVVTQSGIELKRPSLQPTESHELNAEIWRTFVVPTLDRQRQATLDKDVELAIQLNEQEAEDNEAMFECECCYVSYPFEQITHCDTSCHFICFNCISHAANEALFGQGWARNISQEKVTIRCLAPSTDECHGCIPTSMVKRALSFDSSDNQTWHKLENRIALENMTKSGLPILQCPCCTYAEADEASDLELRSALFFAQFVTDYAIRSFKLRFNFSIPALLAFLVFCGATMVYPLVCLAVIASSVLTPNEFAASRLRVTRRRRGLKFWCRSPTCKAVSCSLCFAQWIDPHVCHETTTMSLRHAIEAATTSAVKRTCPKCQLSFVKSSGCNKLVCNCGYAMCYVCRNEIGKEGYGHFCQHFRELGGRCKECDRCDLYIVEDEDAVVRRAAERAEKEWADREGKKDGVTSPGFSQPDARGQQLSFVREEVLSGVKYDEQWNTQSVLDGLLEALSV